MCLFASPSGIRGTQFIFTSWLRTLRSETPTPGFLRRAQEAAAKERSRSPLPRRHAKRRSFSSPVADPSPLPLPAYTNRSRPSPPPCAGIFSSLCAAHLLHQPALGIMPRKRSRARRQLDDSSSDDDDSLILSAARIVQTFSNDKGRHGGSVEGHRVLYRDREGGHDRMFRDYLADNPTYGPEIFRRRFLFFNFGLICFMCSNIIRVVKL